MFALQPILWAIVSLVVFIGAEELVVKEGDNLTTTTTTTTTTSTTTTSTPTLTTIKDVRQLDQQEGFELGDDRIIGGHVAQSGQFPWQVAILESTTFKCGGAVIDKTWVITAGHCIPHKFATFHLIFGSLMFSSGGADGQVRVSRTFVIHEDYKEGEQGEYLANDIALIRLNKPLKWTGVVKPTRLPRVSQLADTFAGQTGTVSGWGKVSQVSRGASAALKFLTVAIISNEECSSRFGDTPIVLETNLCIGSTNNAATCNGDSGGPLVVLEEDGIHTLVGLVSYGVETGCEAGLPNVFTRITHYHGWINKHTGRRFVTARPSKGAQRRLATTRPSPQPQRRLAATSSSTPQPQRRLAATSPSPPQSNFNSWWGF